MSSDLALLVESRAPAALAYGLAVGSLLWLSGLFRVRGAAAAALALALVFVPGGWAAAHLLAGVLAARGLLGRSLEADGRMRRPGLTHVVALTGVYLAAVWAAAVRPGQAGWWLWAATGALAAGAAATAAATGAGPGATPEPGAGTWVLGRATRVRDVGLACLAVLATAGGALLLDVVGPGEPAPIALAGLLAAIVASGAPGPLRVALATILGAPLAALLVDFLT